MDKIKFPAVPNNDSSYRIAALEVLRRLKRLGIITVPNRKRATYAIYKIIHLLDKKRWERDGSSRFINQYPKTKTYTGDNQLIKLIAELTYIEQFTDMEIKRIVDCYKYLIGEVG